MLPKDDVEKNIIGSGKTAVLRKPIASFNKKKTQDPIRATINAINKNKNENSIDAPIKDAALNKTNEDDDYYSDYDYEYDDSTTKDTHNEVSQSSSTTSAKPAARSTTTAAPKSKKDLKLKPIGGNSMVRKWKLLTIQ